MASWYYAVPITIFVLIAVSSCLYRRRMYQLYQQRQQTITVTQVPRGQCQRVIITRQIPPQQQVSTINTVSSAFEPPPSYDDAARNYPKYNGGEFPSHPPGYGGSQQPFHYGFNNGQSNQPQASVPVAGQTSGFTNNAFH